MNARDTILATLDEFDITASINALADALVRRLTEEGWLPVPPPPPYEIACEFCDIVDMSTTPYYQRHCHFPEEDESTAESPTPAVSAPSGSTAPDTGEPS